MTDDFMLDGVLDKTRMIIGIEKLDDNKIRYRHRPQSGK